MIDFWQTVGRIVMDPSLRNRLYAALPIPAGATVMLPSDINSPLIHFSFDHYQATQRAIGPGLFSQFAVGETMAMIFDSEWRENLKALSDYATTQPALARGARTPGFYATLGVLVVDQVLLQSVRAFDNWQDFPADQPDLFKEALTDSQLVEKINHFCQNGDWRSGCFSTFLHYDGHVHPRAFDRPSEVTPSEHDPVPTPKV